MTSGPSKPFCADAKTPAFPSRFLEVDLEKNVLRSKLSDEMIREKKRNECGIDLEGRGEVARDGGGAA